MGSNASCRADVVRCCQGILLAMVDSWILHVARATSLWGRNNGPDYSGSMVAGRRRPLLVV